MSVVEGAVRAGLEWGAADPLSSMVVMLGGFNIQADGVAVDYAVPRAHPLDPAPGILRARRASLWRLMTEVFDPLQTRYPAAGGLSSKLDRALSSLPARAVYGVVARASTLEDTATIHRGGFSDLAAVETQLTLRRMWPVADRPIARAATPAAPPDDAGALGGQHVGGGGPNVVVPARGPWRRECRAGLAQRRVEGGLRRGAQSAVVVAVAIAVPMQRPREARLLLEPRLEAAQWMRRDGGRAEGGGFAEAEGARGGRQT